MENKGIEFLRAQSLADFLEEKVNALDQPFYQRKNITDLLVRLSRNVCRGAEQLLGYPLYVKKINSPLDRLPSRFHKTVQQLVGKGLLKNCVYPEPLPDWPKIPAVQFISDGGIKASGYALDYELAAQKALAEFFEWNAYKNFDSKKLIFGSWREVRYKNAVNPRRFICFSDTQTEEPARSLRERYRDQSILAWVKGVSFIDGRQCFVPAQLVYWGYEGVSREPVLQRTTTNGGAAGTSRDMVFSHAILEAIERDAIMIYWLNKITPQKIDLSGLRGCCGEETAVLLDLFQKYSIDLTLLDITTDIGVPVILAAVRDTTPGRPAIVLGAGADLDTESAITHALLEAIRAGFFASVSEEEIKAARQDEGRIDTITKRKTYWCDKALMNGTDFLFRGPGKEIAIERRQKKNEREKLDILRGVFAKHNLDAYLVDVASPLAKEAGLLVGRAFVPDLYPLYLDEQFKYLGVKRLYEAPVRMGVLKTAKNENEMNVLPHPFL